jgi:hypothetical protein
MSADSVFDQFKHDIASIRIKRMTLRQKYSFSVVDGAAGRQVLFPVVKIEAHEIRHLFSLKVNNFQPLSFS